MADKDKRIQTLLAVVLVLAAFGVLMASDRSVVNYEDGQLVPAQQAAAGPDWSLPDTSTGKQVRLSDLTKKGPVVLDFWATWCGPCKAELPDVSALSRKYAGRVSFYGVNNSSFAPEIEAFRKENGVPFPCLSDLSGKVFTQYGVQGIPLVVLIDTDGKVREGISGYDPDRNLQQMISNGLDSLLSKRS
jgi:thiol-disulfide isomerase/thioredoxin